MAAYSKQELTPLSPGIHEASTLLRTAEFASPTVTQQFEWI